MHVREYKRAGVVVIVSNHMAVDMCALCAHACAVSVCMYV